MSSSVQSPDRQTPASSRVCPEQSLGGDRSPTCLGEPQLALKAPGVPRRLRSTIEPLARKVRSLGETAHLHEQAQLALASRPEGGPGGGPPHAADQIATTTTSL